jgi:hypothetical protein
MIIFIYRSDRIVQLSIRRIVALKMNLDYAEDRISKITFDASIAGSIMLLNQQSFMLRMKDNFLRVFTDAKGDYPGFNFGEVHYNLSNYDCLKIEVTNHDDEAIKFHCRLDSRHSDPALPPCRYNCSALLRAHNRRDLHIQLPKRLPAQLKNKIFGMRGGPERCSMTDDAFHLNSIVGLIIFLGHPNRQTNWSI